MDDSDKQGILINEPPPFDSPLDDEENDSVGEEIQEGVEGDIEGSMIESVQIAAPTEEPSSTAESFDEDDPFLFIELGDRIVIDSKKYGRIIGYVYYRSGELIRVMPDGVSNLLYDFPVSQTDEGEIFEESLGVTAAYVIEKRKFESFVKQQDLRTGQLVETIDSTGEIDKEYTIKSVNETDDAIELQDETGATEDIKFEYYGIPLDSSFVIIRPRQEPVAQPNALPSEEFQQLQEKADEEEESAEEKPAEEEPEVEIVGYVTITKATVYQEAAASEKRYPDNIQKIDALNDFLNGLDPILQKDPKAVRSIRILVETLFYLKQATIAYNEDGSVRGQKELSASTVSELIQKASIPLGRPILDVAKKIYALPFQEESGELPSTDETDEYFFESFKRELQQIVENASPLVSSYMNGAPGGQIVQHWTDIQSFLKKYMSTWTANNTAAPLWKAHQDSDFFRNEVPDLESKTVPGYVPPPRGEGDEPVLDKLSFAIERGIGPTYRKGVDRKKQLLIGEESATMKGYLMFPLKVIAHIGKTRSGNIAIDSGRSQLKPMTMKEILEEVGEPQEVGTSNDLLLLDVNGNTLGNIPLPDYIEGLNIPGLGIGDTFTTLEQFGMDDLELTPELINVLQSKIESYQSQLLSTLGKLREKLAEENDKTPEDNPMIDDLGILEGGIRSEPTLVEDLELFEQINPSLSKSDIAQVAFLLKKHADYFQVAAGNNSVLTARERFRATRDMFLESLKIANLLKIKKADVGEAPLPNKCEHVAKLVSIRKIPDDTERFQLLTKFFAKYQGDRSDNWINCNICERQLMCLHERLLLQSYLSPVDKQTIYKEVLINFSGGQFQGKYICRNCGQPIKDLDFDTHLEYDDEGRPMMGRSVLVDEDALKEEQLKRALGVPIKGEDEQEDEDAPNKSRRIKFNDNEKKYYNIIKEICVRIGIALEDADYVPIITQCMNWFNKLPTPDKYAAAMKKNPKLMAYNKYISIQEVCSSAAYLLLDIQTKTPPYTVNYILKRCDNPGFEGFPLDNNSKQGIEYIACAIASITREDVPWKTTEFRNIQPESKRITQIATNIEAIINKELSDDLIQYKLSEKRKYIRRLQEIGQDIGVPKDDIPATFLPEQITITPSQAAEEAVIPEVANLMGNKGKMTLTKQWIRSSHVLAKKTASLVRGSPLVETTCCLSNIMQPNTFWKSATDLPQIGKRELVPKVQGSFLQVHFTPRPMESLLVEADKELYYRIFLKCCFDGPRKGYPHEPGLTNKCAWCGFQFPTNPAILDTDTEGKSALNSQNINTGTEEFVSLLDKIHEVNNVEPLKQKQISSIEQIMEEFSNIIPVPIEGWKESIEATSQAFLRLTNDASRDEIAAALDELATIASNSQRIVEGRFDEAGRNLLNDIVSSSWSNLFQIIQTYFVTPYQRIITQFNTDSMFVPPELKISEQHRLDIKNFINNDMAVVRLKANDFKRADAGFARAKLQHFVNQMSALLPFKHKIKALVVPGRERTLRYIQRAIFYGPIASLINSSEIPPNYDGSVRVVADKSMKIISDLITSTLTKYRTERLSFDDKQLRELLAIRSEKERTNIIAEFDKMSPEERAVELTMKKLGMGRWAVGGTKAIYAYDPEHYERERAERERAGIIDFPGLGPDDVMPLNGRPTDDIGLFEGGNDEYYEREGGYDHMQMGEDDA